MSRSPDEIDREIEQLRTRLTALYLERSAVADRFKAHGELPIRLMTAVGQWLACEPADIASGDRSESIARARQLVYLLLRKDAGWTFQAIANALGRDHTSVMYGCRVIRDRMAEDAALAEVYEQARRAVFGIGRRAQPLAQEATAA